MAKSNLCENLQQKRFDYVAGMLAGGDSPKAWKAIVDVKQDALKFTSLWLEYSKWDASFATTNTFLNYADGPGTGASCRSRGSCRVGC